LVSIGHIRMSNNLQEIIEYRKKEKISKVEYKRMFRLGESMKAFYESAKSFYKMPKSFSQKRGIELVFYAANSDLKKWEWRWEYPI